jgi:putative phosphoesterase
MRIGVVSDTHNNLRNVARIVELLNGADVDRVIHTGDVTQAKTLDVLSKLEAPLVGVWGNNDEGERHALEPAAELHGFEFYDPPLELHWAERRLVIVHDPRDFDGALRPHHHLALHGHTHLHTEERQGETLIFNPGECAGHMQGRNAIGIVDLLSLEAEILRF